MRPYVRPSVRMGMKLSQQRREYQVYSTTLQVHVYSVVEYTFGTSGTTVVRTRVHCDMVRRYTCTYVHTYTYTYVRTRVRKKKFSKTTREIQALTVGTYVRTGVRTVVPWYSYHGRIEDYHGTRGHVYVPGSVHA